MACCFVPFPPFPPFVPGLPSPLVQFIKANFQGATITVTLVDGTTITGEVVDGFDNVIGLKLAGVITFVNANFIASFV